MEPNDTSSSQPVEDRSRSRSSPGHLDQAGGSPSRKRPAEDTPLPSDRNTRRRRYKPFGSAEEIQALLERYENEDQEWLAKHEAEQARRQALSPEERLKEDGNKLREKLELDPAVSVSLEISRSQRAGCRADPDCLVCLADPRYGNSILDEYRIRVQGVANTNWYGTTTRYYHVRCFSSMVDLEDLIPHKFKWDWHHPLASPGLMVCKWFQHKGHIDPEKIALYLKECEAYNTNLSDCHTYDVRHRRNCEDKEADCSCPPRPPVPSKPKLKGHVTGAEDKCKLEDLLAHPLADDVPSLFLWPEDSESEDQDGQHDETQETQSKTGA